MIHMKSSRFRSDFMARRVSLTTFSLFSTIFLFFLLGVTQLWPNVITLGEESVNFQILYVDIRPERPVSGEKFTVKFVLKNNASANALNISITVTTASELELVSGNSQIHLSEWNAAGVVEATYDFVAQTASDYIIRINIESDNLGSFKGGRLVEVYSKPIIVLADWGWVLLLGAIALILVIAFLIWKR